MTEQDTTRSFLAHLHRGGSFAYWWTVNGDKKTSFWWPADKQPNIPRTSANVYFGVHPTTEIPQTNARGEERKPQWLRSRIDIIAAINCLFAEFDAKDFADDLPATLAVVRQLNPAPSVIISSGGGYHAYWLLTDPWLLTNRDAREQARQVQWAWVQWSGGDEAAKDLARVLRVPGARNYKYQPPRVVEFVCCDLTRTYQIGDLIRLVEPLWAKGKLGVAVEKIQRAPDGMKHDELLRASMLAGGVTHILGQHAVQQELLSAVAPRAADLRNAENTIADGIRYGEQAKLSLNGVNARPAVDEHGELVDAAQPMSAIIIQTLAAIGYTFRLNLCNDSIEVNGQPIDDIVAAKIRVQMRDLHIKPLAAVEDAYTMAAAMNAYHPVQDYLRGLVWDGGDHIAQLAQCMICGDDDIVDDEGRARTLAHIYLRRWLIGAVAKALANEQNLMLVFAGPQGIGKSAFVRWICSGISKYFIEASINVADKDSDVRLMSHFIWEVSELDATTRKADVSALKAFITKQSVSVRKAYGRHDTVKPALASFFGTVNDGSGFLTDETGNRRFLITNVGAIDWGYSQLDVNQVWAEAVAAYRAGETWRLNDQEERQQTQANKQHEAESVLEGWVEMYFDLTGDPDDVLTSAEIVNHLRSKDIRLNGSERAQAMEISRVLTRMGIPKIRTMTWRGYGGIRVRQ